jgi:hypothetical protein
MEDYQGVPVRPRLLTIVLFGLLVAGGVAVAWQAWAEARLVERDLTATREVAVELPAS